ncbi:hypothetical protein CK203_052945 [Vitis vinifera]|uniref:Uncharacterized protein n=1 Tax=Vitis vinifera TaxID=29760 RepID=A0A438GT20_VITVI|nr:hypothetical protein CK203_052945 [Vitis vinifera]
MPKIVAKRFEKLQRDFLWGRGSLERKVHLINWEVVCIQKEKGGLGIQKIDLLNKALLGKWIWRFAFERKILEKVIGVKYGQEGFGWRTNEARGTFGVGVWKEILKEANWCWNNIEFKLFALAVHRNAMVNEVWDSSLGQGGWNLRFSRDFNDWELDLIGDLLKMLRASGYLQRRTRCYGKEEVVALLGLGTLIFCWLLPTPLPSRISAFGWIRSNQSCFFCLGGHVGEDSHLG